LSFIQDKEIALMFITRANSAYEIWHNTKDEDFLQFLPARLSVSKEELEVWHVPPQHRAAFINVIKTGGCTMSITESNHLYVTKLSGEDLVVELDVQIIKVAEWPYNQAGKFVGFQGL
jgi:hypothetical protein